MDTSSSALHPEPTQKQKVDMIFSYLFSTGKMKDEDAFWNRLKPDEIRELEKICKEPTLDFSILEKKYL
jgi:hypothetical protein